MKHPPLTLPLQTLIVFSSSKNMVYHFYIKKRIFTITFFPLTLTAKMVSTLDVISNGRIDFGLSAGWHRSEIAMVRPTGPFKGTN